MQCQDLVRAMMHDHAVEIHRVLGGGGTVASDAVAPRGDRRSRLRSELQLLVLRRNWATWTRDTLFVGGGDLLNHSFGWNPHSGIR